MAEMPANRERKTPRPNPGDLERHRRFVQAYLDLSNPQTFLKAKPLAISVGYPVNYAHGRLYKRLDRVGVQGKMRRLRDEGPKI
jgi:hypothetical protein